MVAEFVKSRIVFRQSEGQLVTALMVVNRSRPPQSWESATEIATEIRVKGTVQGVGFRPTVYRLASECGLRGEVYNDAEGVIIRVAGLPTQIHRFVERLRPSAPPLATIASIERQALAIATIPQTTFEISPSRAGHRRTQISPDAATCPQCLADTLDPAGRFYRYPFTNCTHCGPRLSIIRAIPYDRAHTSMTAFPMCPTCQQEYDDPLNRRFHAQPVACPACGPHVWLENAGGQLVSAEQFAAIDPIDAACTLIQQGEIVAIKGLGGFHLACDATQEATVRQLRDRKRRYHKPFALMVRDLSVIAPYCDLSAAEQDLLESAAAPIVLLRKKPAASHQPRDTSDPTLGSQPASPPPIAPSVSPQLPTLGVMLPYTPLHHLLLERLERPIVLTSGNLSDEPQCIDNEQVRSKLGNIASSFLLHDRPIVNRVDDSVVRVVGEQRQTLRRARGYAPAPLHLPPGFENAPPILAMGGELKSTFCLSRAGEAVLSQHLGDLANPIALAAYQQTQQLYQDLFEHQPTAIAVDLHPDYLSTKLGEDLAHTRDLPLFSIQHHHAHIAATMVEHGLPLDTSPVLGIALDGLGYGNDGTLWGGEFLLADYHNFERLGHLESIAMLGGAQATRQPWRNTYAHLSHALGWETLTEQFGNLELVQFLAAQPRRFLDQMLATGTRSPLASSAGRLFDAVAAAVGCCREGASYEGQGAIELEALITSAQVDEPPYPLAIKQVDDRAILTAAPLWRPLLQDLQQGLDRARIAARFHHGLATAIATLAITLTNRHQLSRVVLSGGVFQNHVLLLAVQTQLQQAGLTVLTPHQIPPNDGGIALGQVAIAAARCLHQSP